jgi:hypothetical protein
LYAQGALLVANNPVSILITTGDTFGQTRDTEYPYVTPNTLPLVSGTPDVKNPGKNVEYLVGVQVKSALVGIPAQVSGWLIEPQLAGLGLGTIFNSTVNPSGAVTNPVTTQLQRVTTLPPSPVDTAIISVDMNATFTGVEWMMIWNASTSSWDFLGGGRALSVVGAAPIAGDSAWHTLTSVTAPFSGTYELDGGYFGITNAAGSPTYLVGWGINGTIQAQTGNETFAGGNFSFGVQSIPWQTTVVAGQTINLMGNAGGAVIGGAVECSLGFRPTRFH